VDPEPLATRDPDAWLEFALARLTEWGLIMDSDPQLPSWPSLVAERPVRGSWWADRMVHVIHTAGSRLIDHEDVIHVVLVSGKRTCVHRRLWPAFLAVAVSMESWKLNGLSQQARAIWERVQRDSHVYADEPDLPSTDVRENGRSMRELEARMLCAGGDVHTPRGSHAKFVMNWDAWMTAENLTTPDLSAGAGRQQLDECLDRLNREFGGHGTLPWWRLIPLP
jgi:hypothetical protein